MATGINTQEMTELKVSLLDYIEQINGLVKRFNDCCYNIGQNMSGACCSQIIYKLEIIKAQFPIVISNINSYITDLNMVQRSYEDLDVELGSTVTSDITLIDNMKGDA